MKSTFKTIKEELIEEKKIIDGIKKGIRGVVDVLDAALVPRGIAGGGKKCACRGEGWVNCECSKSNRKKKEHMGDKEEIKEESLEELKVIVDKILEEGGDVFKKHQMKIAIATLKMSDAGAKLAGGMSKEEARNFLKKAGWGDAKISKLEESEESGILEEKKGKKKKKKGKKSMGVIGYGFGYNNDDMVGDSGDGGGISEGQVITDAVGEFFELMVNLPIHSAPPLYFWKELVDSSKIAKMAYDKNRGIGRN